MCISAITLILLTDISIPADALLSELDAALRQNISQDVLLSGHHKASKLYNIKV